MDVRVQIPGTDTRLCTGRPRGATWVTRAVQTCHSRRRSRWSPWLLAWAACMTQWQLSVLSAGLFVSSHLEWKILKNRFTKGNAVVCYDCSAAVKRKGCQACRAGAFSVRWASLSSCSGRLLPGPPAGTEHSVSQVPLLWPYQRVSKLSNSAAEWLQGLCPWGSHGPIKAPVAVRCRCQEASSPWEGRWGCLQSAG